MSNEAKMLSYTFSLDPSTVFMNYRGAIAKIVSDWQKKYNEQSKVQLVAISSCRKNQELSKDTFKSEEK